MTDNSNRNIHYLRISVTDRCNLRCTYCMPESGTQYIRHQEILSYEEILHLAGLFARLGIDRVRLTGGEPLVRKDIDVLVSGLKKIPGIRWVGITTNGVLLTEQLPALWHAGLDAVNISLDTLDEKEFHAITRRNLLSKALEGLRAAQKIPGLQVRVNCVPLLQNKDQWTAMAALAKNSPGIDVRFIELMPIGLGSNLTCQYEEDVLTTLEKTYGPAVPEATDFECGPSRYVRFRGFAGRVGFISALSHQFCSNCNRVRLMATGELKPCLQYNSDVNLKLLLRSGADDDTILWTMKETIYHKPVSHHFRKASTLFDEEHNMNQIGG